MQRYYFYRIILFFFLIFHVHSLLIADKNKSLPQRNLYVCQNNSLCKEILNLADSLKYLSNKYSDLMNKYQNLSSRFDTFKSESEFSKIKYIILNNPSVLIILIIVLFIILVFNYFIYKVLFRSKKNNDDKEYLKQVYNHKFIYNRQNDSHLPIKSSKKSYKTIVESKPTNIFDKTSYLQLSKNSLQNPLQAKFTTTQKSNHEDELFVNKIISSYNSALKNIEASFDFLDKYRCVRIGVINASERRSDSSIKPIYQKASEGDYLVINLQKQNNHVYIALPRFDFIIQNSTYISSAIGIVFDFSGFEKNLRYKHYKLIEPAIFKPTTGENWQLLKPGILDIGKGE